MSADNQQERLYKQHDAVSESSTTTCSAPRRVRRQNNPDYIWDKSVRRWAKKYNDDLKWCWHCDTRKPISDFYDKATNNGVCRECHLACQAAKRYGITSHEALALKQIETCECCGTTFQFPKDQTIHHLEIEGHKIVRAVVCQSCNLILQDESEERKEQLKACLQFMGEDIV